MFFLRFIRPIYLSKLLQLYDQEIFEENRSKAYVYSAVIVFTTIFSIITMHYSVVTLQQVGLKIRVACCAMIYRKSLRLSKSALAETTAGQIVNLMSNDVSRFDHLFRLHNLFLGPINIILGMLLVYLNVGWIALIGATLMFLSIPIQCEYQKMFLPIDKREHVI